MYLLYTESNDDLRHDILAFVRSFVHPYPCQRLPHSVPPPPSLPVTLSPVCPEPHPPPFVVGRFFHSVPCLPGPPNRLPLLLDAFFTLQPGLMCPNAACGAYYWGAGSEAACVSTLYQRLTLAIRGHIKVYYQTYLRCDDR